MPKKHTVRAVNPAPPPMKGGSELGVRPWARTKTGIHLRDYDTHIKLSVVPLRERKGRWYIEARYFGDKAKSEGNGVFGYVGKGSKLVLDRGRAIVWDNEAEAQEIAERAMSKLDNKAANPAIADVVEVEDIYGSTWGANADGYYLLKRDPTGGPWGEPEKYWSPIAYEDIPSSVADELDIMLQAKASNPTHTRKKRGKSKDWIKREGKLGGPGYTNRKQADRRAILKKCVKEYGYRSCLGSVQVLLRSRELESKTRKRLTSDKNWLVKTYGGPGSFDGATAKGNPEDGTLFYGVIGDVNPIEHWGGFVSDSGNGPHLTYFQSYEGEDGLRVTVSGVSLEEDVTADVDWVDWADIAASTGAEASDLLKWARDPDPLVRAQVYAEVGGHYGWNNLDSYPQELTLEEAEERYDSLVEAAHAASKMRSARTGNASNIRKIKNRVLR